MMNSKYEVFLKVIETGSFTRAADALGYTQSGVSQTVKALETELDTTLIVRRKDGLSLTSDGKEYYSYFQAIWNAEKALADKKREMNGLENRLIRIGAFTSVTKNILPKIMKEFRQDYPHVRFDLRQGNYEDIADWVKEDTVDFGFIGLPEYKGLIIDPLYKDSMMAVLSEENPLSAKKTVSLQDLSKETFILLDEGEFSVPLEAFERYAFRPEIAYRVYDDYTILEMIRQNMGVSIMYSLVLKGFEKDLCLRPVKEPFSRTIGIVYKNRDTMPRASRLFMDRVTEYIRKEFQQ